MIVCPLCKSNPVKILRSSTATQVANSFTPKNVDVNRYNALKQNLNKLWKNQAVNIAECWNCKLIFANPFIAGDAEFYSIQAPNTPYPKSKWEYTQTLSKILQLFAPSRISVLDIGAGKGYFLRQLLSQGFTPQSLMSTEFSSVGKASIESVGVECQSVDIRDLKTTRKFDVICMFQVLEHMDRLDELFSTLHELSNPGTCLFIAVPYGKRIEFNEQFQLLLDNPPNHVSRWSHTSFKVLAEKYNWELSGIELQPAHSMYYDMLTAMIDSYLRKTQAGDNWESRIAKIATNTSLPTRYVKALGMIFSPNSWRTAFKVRAYNLKHGVTSESMWVHLTRTA